MSKLSLSFACWNYDRVQGIIDGTIQPEGIELNFLKLPVEETFFRMMRHQEFDVSEMSLSSYLIARDRGFPKFTAIPVFPSRSFRHSGIYVNVNSGIKEPKDLIGKRVGIPEYQVTASVFIRGMLQHEYGVHPSDLLWFSGGQEKPGRIEKINLSLPPEIKIQPIDPHKTLNQMLEEGEIDALVCPRAPSCFVKGSPNVKRLFDDHAAVEQEYFRKTGIFPIMHLVAIKDEILEKNPWVAQNLFKAFAQAKNDVYDSFNQNVALNVMLPWLATEVQRTKKLMGDDFWPYGLEKNRITLNAMVDYSFEQGLIKSKPQIEDLFAKSTLEEFTI